MQVAVIEFARNVMGLEGANSSELDENTKYPVIDIMRDQIDIKEMGGTMRLGAYPCKIDKESKLYEIYGKELISERHRHRFEFNNKYRAMFLENGMKFGGISPDLNLVEAVELKTNNFFVGVQYHPELLSRPNRPHPLFVGLVNASKEEK